ncbi:MAG: hypothetical protein EOP12_01650 [Pseudomonas sp.]|nr:MAG: hypothetical protein EOP12_01650 [Pseudomonas sp.]
MNNQLNLRNFIACFLLALTAGCVGPMKDWPNVLSGTSAADPVIFAVEAHYTAHGKYPESLDVLGLPEEVMEDARNKKLRYFSHQNGSIASISFQPQGGVPAFCVTGSYLDWKWGCMGK